MNKFQIFCRWFRQHFAIRVRNLGDGYIVGCFGPICFVLSVYRCGIHITAADAVAHMKKEEM